MKNHFIVASIILSGVSASANLLKSINDKLNTVDSVTRTTNRVGRTTDRLGVKKTASSTAKDKHKEWQKDLRIAESAAAKVCKKKIKFEFDSQRFRNFESPGQLCGDIAKALEFDLCTDSEYLPKVKSRLDEVKCFYTSQSNSTLKLKMNNKQLLVGFSEKTSDIYNESLLWLQNNL